MKKILALLALCAVTMFGGCKTVAEIPDDQLAAGIKALSYNSVYYGFKAVLANNPGKYQQLAADVATTTSILRSNVIPVFSGASTSEVLTAAVDQTLGQLNVSSTVNDVIKVALVLVESQITLPTNPAEKLDARTKGALLAFFTGVADGLDKAVADTPPPPPPTARIVPPSMTKLKWENR